MVKLEGTYEYVSQENYLEYLKTLGVEDAEAQKQAALKVPIVIKSVTSDSITLAYGEKSLSFPINKELEHTLSTGHTVWTTVSVKGSVITFKSKLTQDGSLTEEKVFTITDSGLTSSSSNSKGGKAVRQYKRA